MDLTLKLISVYLYGQSDVLGGGLLLLEQVGECLHQEVKRLPESFCVIRLTLEGGANDTQKCVKALEAYLVVVAVERRSPVA